jgi:hypothetical protein
MHSPVPRISLVRPTHTEIIETLLEARRIGISLKLRVHKHSVPLSEAWKF